MLYFVRLRISCRAAPLALQFWTPIFKTLTHVCCLPQQLVINCDILGSVWFYLMSSWPFHTWSCKEPCGFMYKIRWEFKGLNESMLFGQKPVQKLSFWMLCRTSDVPYDRRKPRVLEMETMNSLKIYVSKGEHFLHL